MSNESRARRRFRAGFPLLVGGAALLLAALISWVGLAVTQLDGYPWTDNSIVPSDGQPHTVKLSGDSSAMVWSYEANATPNCTAIDTASGQVLPQKPVDGSYRRQGGSAGDWFGVATFQPRTSTVEVTCTLGDGERSRSWGLLGEGGGVLVAVDKAPVMPPALATFGPWGALPVSLAVAGLLAVVSAALLGKCFRASS